MSNIFDNEVNESSVRNIMSTMKVYPGDNDVPMVSFAPNCGKGTGAQVMRVSDFREYVETVQHYADNGVEDIPVDDNLSPAETVRQTISSSDGVISFRVRSGKGAKPAKISVSEFNEVAELLSGTVDVVEAAALKISSGDKSGDDE
jgi:hypothetical protein